MWYYLQHNYRESRIWLDTLMILPGYREVADNFYIIDNYIAKENNLGDHVHFIDNDAINYLLY